MAAIPEQRQRERWLHVISGLHQGGAEASLYRLLDNEEGRRIDHTVVSLSDPGSHTDALKAIGVVVNDLGLRSPLSSPKGVWALRDCIRTLRPDFIHGWMYHGCLAASLGRRAARSEAPLLWNLRRSAVGLEHEKLITRGLVRICARFSRDPQFLVYNSYRGAQSHTAIGFCRSNALVIPNGIDCDVFAPARRQGALNEALELECDCIRLGAVGRFHPVKGHRLLLEAVAKLRKERSDFCLILIGNGMTLANEELRAVIESLGLGDKIRLLGSRQDVADLMPELDVLISASVAEGFPNVVAEAMACAVPVVATDAGDSKRIVGRAGKLVAPGSVDELAAALSGLLKLSASRRRRMGRIGRERIRRHYDIEATRRAYFELCRGPP